mmetsp:Transcript_2384/g.3527  ORF Transcript_2384/g.3527 Transcript_2384/m.3527 type:complete len:412 (-) Transcript_2384:37-1272(-)
MGMYTLFDDYLINGFDSYYVVLKDMQNLCSDDARLLVPALFYLGSERGKEARATKYSLSLSREQVVQLFDLALLLGKLQGHHYNTYECCFLAIGALDKETALCMCMATFSLIAQILLLFILVYYNMRDIVKVSSWRTDFTIVVAIITSIFFAKLVHMQWRNASDFNAVFWKAGFPNVFVDKVKVQLRNALLGINILVNGGLGALIVVFNFFFLMISKNVNEAIINSLALFFILEMDDTLRPDWDKVKFDSGVVSNLACYSTDDGGHFQAEIISPSASEEDYLLLLESDDKVYFVTETNEDELAVNIYWGRRYTPTEKTVQFRISGENGHDLFDSIKKFRCVRGDELSSVIDRAKWKKDLVEDIVNAHTDKHENKVISFGHNKLSHPVHRLASFDTLVSNESISAQSDEEAP